MVPEMSQKCPALSIGPWRPGVIGRITALHSTYYHEHWGFDLSFEIQVAGELAAFMDNFDPKRDYFGAAFSGGDFAGAVAVDGKDAQGQGARLRWFIVDPKFQGRGLGRELLKEAVSFCDRAGHDKMFLMTFRGLDAARRLYEKAGFTLAEEEAVGQWGNEIIEQKFTRLRPKGYSP
ncbi:MAG: GNAT family N-acetyltransferase [Deltaproteobacteria bacterium]|nr:GNAT family N-acetyltransferase [Deltaproteobacteria bacterium]